MALAPVVDAPAHAARGGGSDGGSDCGQTATTPAGLEAALSRAAPGDTVCVGPGDYGTAPIEIEQSGEAGKPIVVRATGGVVVPGFRVRADHVALRGFEVTAPDGGTSGESLVPGISLRGRGLVAYGNVVHDTAGDGIACESDPPWCEGAVIAHNTIERADGTGIVVFGRGNLVESNDVANSVARRADDADGIRFFGEGHVLRANRIHDMTDAGYAADPPHTDCFQTFDNGKPPTVGVVIDGNICDNVAHQCLIATAEESGELGMIGRSHSLQFTNNVCRNGGSQGVLVEQFPDVLIAFNAFADTIQYRAVIFLDGSTEGGFIANLVDGNYRAYELDDSSRRGWRADHNLRRLGPGAPPPAEPGVENVEFSFAPPGDGPLADWYRSAPGSPGIDAGVVVDGVERDIIGARRPLDGGTGVAAPDVGPYEHLDGPVP